jgi:K+-sensing histidine kinase KdpD
MNKKQGKSVSKEEISSVKRKLHQQTDKSNWTQAAEDALVKIKEHQQKIRLLRQAARVFERYEQEGQTWPQKA